jgi:hypothetical protein
MHEQVGAPCGFCGHTNLVHPGAQNPSLEACAICSALAVSDPQQLARARGIPWPTQSCAHDGCDRTDDLRMAGPLGKVCPDHFVEP